MKMAGTRRGTSVALAGVLQAFASSGDAASPVVPDTAPVRQRVFDFEHVTNDPATRALIDAGRTMGCFYIESPGMRALFERLRCRTFNEVVAASSIIRPGVAESGMMQEYIVRHQQQQSDGSAARPDKGRDPRAPATLMPPSQASRRLADGTMPINAYAKARPLNSSPEPSKAPRRSSPAPPSPLMLRILPETHGVMVYQEDVLRVAHRVAGMTLGEADVLRRIMSGKGKCRDQMTRLEDLFFNGARENGISDDDAQEIWRQMSSFAGYSFCKGHSAAFAALSYQIAWLKAHYPAEFFAALLTNEGGFYGAGAYIEEARRWGLEVLPPCVNKSKQDYTGRTLGTTDQPFVARGWVRVGLGAVMGLSSQSRRRLIAERRKGGRYQSLRDFVERSGIGAEECRALGKAGALDDVEKSLSDLPAHARRPTLLLDLACLLKERELYSGSSFVHVEFSLRNDEDEAAQALPSSVSPDLSPAELCRYEGEHLGFMVSGHPLDLATLPPGIIPARDIREYDKQRIRMAGWCIAAKLLSARNSGRLMKMLTLEDRTDTFEAVLFPRVYARFAPRTLSHGPYLVEGKVDMTLGSPTLNVERIGLLT